MSNTKQIGNIGEEYAQNFLKEKGYQILKTNWFYHHKEIDIIATKEDTLCFVEVKTRTTNFSTPKDAVTLKKQRNLIVAANQFIQQGNYDMEARFDIIEVIIIHKNVKIHHIKEAFIP